MTALLLALSTSPAAANAEEDEEVRLAAEARTLFQVIVADDKQPLQPCLYSDVWEGDSIPEDLARRFMGSMLHAALASPGVSVTPIDVVPPGKSDPGAFCGSDAYVKGRNAKLAAFMAGTDAEIHLRRTTYSFPIFDRDYRTAMLVVSSEPNDLYRKNGVVPRGEIEYFSYVRVYRKVNGRWRFIASDLQSAT